MDEDINNKMMCDEHERMEHEAKALTRGCGLLFLIIAVFAALVCIIYSIIRL